MLINLLKLWITISGKFPLFLTPFFVQSIPSKNEEQSLNDAQISWFSGRAHYLFKNVVTQRSSALQGVVEMAKIIEIAKIIESRFQGWLLIRPEGYHRNGFCMQLIQLSFWTHCLPYSSRTYLPKPCWAYSCNCTFRYAITLNDGAKDLSRCREAKKI